LRFAFASVAFSAAALNAAEAVRHLRERPVYAAAAINDLSHLPPGRRDLIYADRCSTVSVFAAYLDRNWHCLGTIGPESDRDVFRVTGAGESILVVYDRAVRRFDLDTGETYRRADFVSSALHKPCLTLFHASALPYADAPSPISQASVEPGAAGAGFRLQDLLNGNGSHALRLCRKGS
jgi:hypothetical protein